jgi:transcriptional regulator with XRE-family HTH domain
MNKNEELAKRLKYWRKNKNHTQDSLADLTDMTRKAISAYENAKSFISYGAAKKLADALGISPLYLLCETDDPYETNSEYTKKPTESFSVNETKETHKLPVFVWEALKAKKFSLEPPVDFYLSPSNCEGDFWIINASTSMQPLIQKDDYLLVNKELSDLKDGDVVLFKVNKKIDIMYYTETKKHFFLYPSSPKTVPVVVFKNKTGDFSIIGKITAFLRKTS